MSVGVWTARAGRRDSAAQDASGRAPGRGPATRQQATRRRREHSRRTLGGPPERGNAPIGGNRCGATMADLAPARARRGHRASGRRRASARAAGWCCACRRRQRPRARPCWSSPRTSTTRPRACGRCTATSTSSGPQGCPRRCCTTVRASAAPGSPATHPVSDLADARDRPRGPAGRRRARRRPGRAERRRRPAGAPRRARPERLPRLGARARRTSPGTTSRTTGRSPCSPPPATSPRSPPSRTPGSRCATCSSVSTSTGSARSRRSTPADRRISYMPRRGGADVELALRLLGGAGDARRLGGAARWRDLAADEVAARLQHTQVFLSVSHREGFGMPPLEAMACGAYVVGYDALGGREFLRPDVACPVETGNVLALARALDTRAGGRAAPSPAGCAAAGSPPRRPCVRRTPPSASATACWPATRGCSVRTRGPGPERVPVPRHGRHSLAARPARRSLGRSCTRPQWAPAQPIARKSR